MMVAFLWTGGVYRNRLQDFRARILVFVILLVQLSNETISTYRINRLPLCNFFGQVFGQGCHLSVYLYICMDRLLLRTHWISPVVADLSLPAAVQDAGCPTTESLRKRTIPIARGGSLLIGVALPVFQARTRQACSALPDLRHLPRRHGFELLRDPDIIFDLPDGRTSQG